MKDEQRFFDSTMVQDAVVRNLQTLAESTQRLSSSLKATESGVSWDAIAGFRNVLVHNYLGMDLELVWSVVEIDLPELGAAIERMTQVLTSARTPTLTTRTAFGLSSRQLDCDTPEFDRWFKVFVRRILMTCGTLENLAQSAAES